MSTVTPTVAPAVCPLRGFCTAVQEKYSRFVDWTSANSVDLKTRFGVADADCTVKKVAKVFFTFIASLLLSPISLAVSAYSWAKGKVSTPTEVAATNQPAAPPAATPEAPKNV